MTLELFNAPAEVRVLEQVGNTQRCYEFSNGWGASVIRGPYTYGGSVGLWELAVTEGVKGPLNYDTPITDDVIGYQTEEEIEDLLLRISELPPLVKESA